MLPTRSHHNKRKGELSELAFAYKAASMGFGVAKPYGDAPSVSLKGFPLYTDLPSPTQKWPHSQNTSLNIIY